MSKKKTIANWGNYPKLEAEVDQPVFVEEVQQKVREAKQILARGNGRCYGDAALEEQVVSTLQLDKVLDFDKKNGTLTCQSGILLKDILALIVPQGWFLPVTPGTWYISLGGAIAADVHGKNHHKEGCFSQHLLHFDLLTGEGEIHRCSREENAELFWNTIGNMGLTGIITQATFRLKTIETAYIRQETLKAKNLEEVMQFFEASEDWTYTVAWIDCFQKDNKQGRSLLMRGEHARLEELPSKQRSKALQLSGRLPLMVPSFFPSFLLNNWTVRLFNFLYYRKQWSAKKTVVLPYDRFFYPLDAIQHWNRLYGKKGFTQYQFVLPKEQSKAGLKVILETIRQSGQGSFLSVLKLFGAADDSAIHSFPVEGYTLALDFKINAQTPALIQKLDQLVAQYQGKIYRAKDAFSAAKLSHAKQVKRDTKFSSQQAKRLGI